jgi:predicted nucleotidyltransferase
MSRPAAVDVLPEGYQALFDRAAGHLLGDGRVRGLWLGGSLARGTADSASDLDLIVAVADASYDEFVSAWRTWLDEITPTVLAAEVPFRAGAFYSVTPRFERFDVVVERASAVATTGYPTRVVVFDKDELDAQLPPPLAGPGPSADVVSALVTEFFRISAVETILVRDDWLLAREHLHVLASLIYRLFVEANAPLPITGVKQWGTKLTHAQRAAMLALPTAASDIHELRAAHLASAALFVTNAEALSGRLGATWPVTLEQAARAHLERYLSLPYPYPRTAPLVV